jgi:hypothetical protein
MPVLIEMVTAVKDLQSLRFLDRRITPDCFFAKADHEVPYTICKHEFTTNSTNKNKICNVPDSIYTYKNKSWTDSNRRADLNSISLILISTQIGQMDYMEKARSFEGRKRIVTEFLNGQQGNNFNK